MNREKENPTTEELENAEVEIPVETAQEAEEPNETPEPTREEQLEARLADTEDRYKRVLAEYQNFRSRSQKEKDALYLDSVCATAAGFLPVIDTLERALEQESDEGFRKSLELIMKQYNECLERFGIKPFGERGETFDPNLHNAVMQAEDEELETNTIAEVLLRGYILGERVVRHAVVKVAL